MEQKFRNVLGFNIRLERLKLHYSQEKLAELADISTKHLTKIENGGSTPSVYLVYKLAQIFHVSIDQLCKEDENYNRWADLMRIHK